LAEVWWQCNINKKYNYCVSGHCPSSSFYLKPVRRYGLALPIGPIWVDSTWRRRQNQVSETLCDVLNKNMTTDNVQKHNFNHIPSSQILDLIKEKPVFKMLGSFCVTASRVSYYFRNLSSHAPDQEAPPQGPVTPVARCCVRWLWMAENGRGRTKAVPRIHLEWRMFQSGQWIPRKIQINSSPNILPLARCAMNSRNIFFLRSQVSNNTLGRYSS
jgi:hypothetical protein